MTKLETAQKTTIWNRNFICVVLANMMLCLAHFAVNPLVASYATDILGQGPRVMGLLTGMFFGVALAMRPVSGPMITKVDKRALLIAVFALGSAANIGYALFQTVPLFVTFRFLNGVQYSFVGSLIMTLAGDNLPPEKLASGMGIYGVGGAVGSALAPSVGITLVDFGTRLRDLSFGYKLMFCYAAAIMALAIIPALILRPDKKTKAELASAGKWYSNIVSVHAIPTAVIMLLITLAYSLYSTFTIKFAEEQRIAGISVFYFVLAGTLVLSRPFSGMLSDRLGVRRILFPALALFAVSFLIFGSSKSLAAALFGAVIAAIGYGASQPTVQAMCMQTLPPIKRGVASNTLYIGMDLGFFLGPLLGGFVCNAVGYAATFKLTAIPVAAAAVCVAVLLPGYYRRLKYLSENG